MTFQPSGLPSPVQSFGSSRARNAALIAATVRGLVGGRHLLEAAAPHRVASGEVEVDLHRAAGVAGLRLADRLAGRRAAVDGLRPRQQAEVDEHLAGVDRRELRREAVVGGDEGRQVAVAHVLLRQPHRRVGALVRVADERLALLDAAVRRAVDLDVVVGRVRRAVGQLRHEPEELVLELVGDGVADQGEVGLVRVEHVLDQRVVGRRPVEALLDVGLLADDAGLEHREVAGLRRRELLGNEVLERAGEAGLAGPASASVAFARVTEVWKRRTCERSPASRSTLMSMPPVLPFRSCRPGS